MQYQFGSGNLYGLPATSAVGVVRKFGALQDVSLDISYSEKTLYGQSQFALDVVRGQAKIAGKAKLANINAGMFNDLFMNGALSTGSQKFSYGETSAIPATPFQVTVVNSANWVQDLGVFDLTSGLAMTRASSPTASGQYSVTAGVYTFYSGDTGHQVAIDYMYTASSTGSTVAVTNILSGSTPYFQVHFPVVRTINGVAQTMYFKLFKCTSTKLTIATKIEDFVIPEFDFVGSADYSGNVYTFTNPE